MKFRILLLVCLSVLSNYIVAQVGINDDLSIPDPSAMLDVKSIQRGMLIPA